MKIVFPVIVGHTEGASSHGVTRSTAGDRSQAVAEQFENLGDHRSRVDAPGDEADTAGVHGQQRQLAPPR